MSGRPPDALVTVGDVTIRVLYRAEIDMWTALAEVDERLAASERTGALLDMQAMACKTRWHAIESWDWT